MLFNSCLISLILFYTFESNFLIEYCKLFKIDKFLPYFKQYKETVAAGGQVNYFNYIYKLAEIDNRFLIKLISCPICFSFWLSIFISLLAGQIYSPPANFFGLGGYFLLKILYKNS